VAEADDGRLAAGLRAPVVCAGRLAAPLDGLAVDELLHAAAIRAIAATLETAARAP